MEREQFLSDMYSGEDEDTPELTTITPQPISSKKVDRDIFQMEIRIKNLEKMIGDQARTIRRLENQIRHLVHNTNVRHREVKTDLDNKIDRRDF